MRPASQRASTAWTPQEDRLLMEARARGENWGPIQQAHFATKTPNACRKRHERLREKRNVENWDEERLEGLAKEYMIMRKEIWSPLADRVGEKWSVVEAKCMEKGLRSIHSVVRTAERRDAAASVTSGTDDSGVAGLGTEVDLDEEGRHREDYTARDRRSPGRRRSKASPGESWHAARHRSSSPRISSGR